MTYDEFKKADRIIGFIRKNCENSLEWKDNKWWLDHLSFPSRRKANDFIKHQSRNVPDEIKLKILKNT
jgi:hypothetical protein